MTIAVLPGTETSGDLPGTWWADVASHGSSAPRLVGPEPFPSPWPRPVLRLVGDGDIAARRAAVGADPDGFRTITAVATHAGRRRVSARVRRRRLLVSVFAATALTAVLVPFGALLGRPLAGGSGSLVGAAFASGLPTSTEGGQGTFYVVRPGDTLASIAGRIQPSNPGPVLAELAARVGSNRIVPGEHVPLS